jgi:Xaa-Pro aminopeptidase
MTEHPSRIDQLQAEMQAASVDALFLCLAENILLATGYWLQIGNLGFAVVPREGTATLIIPEYEAAEAQRAWAGELRTFAAIRLDRQPAGQAILEHLGETATGNGVKGGRIGFEGSFQAVAPPVLDGEPNTVASGALAMIRTAFETEELVDFTAGLEDIRAVKTPNDIERLRTTSEIACFGLDAFKETAVPGRTEAEVAAAVNSAIVSKGHGHRGTRVARSYPTVWSGPETAEGWQYFRHRNRVIEPNDVVMIELGTVADGYWADHTRTVVAGKATETQKSAFDAVMAASRVAFDVARPGVSGGEVDAASRAACAAAGFEQFPHHTGHGTGFRYHESRPQIVPGSDHVIAAGHVIATEPGVYAEGLGGFRHEDNAVVTEDGAKVLATTSYGLDD